MTTSTDRPFPIQNITNKRIARPRFTEGVVLINIKNMFREKSFILPRTLKGAVGKYKHQQWREYFYMELRKRTLPYHFYCEELAKDWSVMLGCNQSTRSWYLQELIDHKLISHEYRDYKVVAISHDTDMSPYPDRLMMILSDSLLSYFEKYHVLNWDTSIKFFEEILDSDWQHRKEKFNFPFAIEPDRYRDYNGNRIAMRRMVK